MRAARPLPRPVDERSAMRYYSACTTGIEAYILNRPVTEYYPAAIPRSELDPILPGHRLLP